ncbi:MAG: solute-binding protein [Acidobacteria bacterium]|nr:solute-binding protein [Acidobacteriota bacterium]
MGCRTGPPPLRVATTTSVENSGLLTAILPAFERESGLTVEVLPVGSGQALNLIRRGDASVGITHDPPAEAAALKSGDIAAYRKFMFNDFLIVGPASDPAGIRGATDAGNAFHRIATEQAVFVSRGDASGTYSREQELWTAAGQKPPATRLLETGQGMGATLRVASERDAYTLTDRATFEQFRSRLRLAVIHEGGPELLNTYSVFLSVRASGAPRDAGMRLADWLTDGNGRMLIDGFVSNNQPVFRIWPAGSPATQPSDLPIVQPAHAR